MNPQILQQFFQTYYNNNSNPHVQFEFRIVNENENLFQIVSEASSLTNARLTMNKIKFLLPLAEANIVESNRVPGQYRAIVSNPVAVYESYLKNEGKINLFLQTLYNNNAASKLQFEGRSLNVRGQKALQIVSPALNEHEGLQVVNQLKKLLPESANITLINSKKVPGQFRALINNPEEIFIVYVKKMIDRLNKAHPIPTDFDNFNIIHSWTNPMGGHVLGYHTYVTSSYQTDLVNPKFRYQLIRKINDYNENLQKSYPGLIVNIERHKGGDAYIIDNFTYEHFEAVQKAYNQRSLRQLALSFFRKPEEYSKVKEQLPIFLRDDAGLEYIDFDFGQVDKVKEVAIEANSDSNSPPLKR